MRMSMPGSYGGRSGRLRSISGDPAPKQHPRYTRKMILRILTYLRPYRGREVAVFILMAIGVILAAIDPQIMKQIIDRALAHGLTSVLTLWVLILIGVYLIRYGFRVIQSYLFGYVGQNILFDIRLQLFRHIESLDMGFFSSRRAGEVISRINNDVAALQSVASTAFVSMARDILMAIVFFCFAMREDWKLPLISLCTFPLFIITVRYFSRRIRVQARRERRKVADVLSFFQEVIPGIQVVQSFTREDYEADRLSVKGHEMKSIRINLAVLTAVSSTCISLLAFLLPTVVVLWFGGRNVIAGTMTLGSLWALLMYLNRLFNPIYRAMELNVSIHQALASIERIFEILDIEPAIQDLPDAHPLPTIEGHILFKGVSFTYDEREPVLNEVNLEIGPRRLVAIVGPTGAGKTTTLNLICRFYDPQHGAVLIDGYDLRSVSLNSLRSQIGVVAQDVLLFNASIRENLRYGKPEATEIEIIEASRRAHLHDFIMSLSHGYDTEVGDRGVRLSGGQKQQLAIARALLRNPRILILDEATSSLDSRSEKAIQDAIAEATEKCTIIAVAHRLSTVLHADKIIVIDKGRVVDEGPHHELYARGGLYKRLYDTQFSVPLSTSASLTDEV
jgi:subfamily B ATP-binding cassette protein MsbA